MSEIKKKFFGTSSFFVFFFGLFVICSLLLQCIVPFIGKLIQFKPEYVLLQEIFNPHFQIPMKTISWIWGILCGSYVFSDRCAFTITAYISKDAYKNKTLPDVGNFARLRFIIWESFIIYSIAVLLYMIFDTDLQLEPLLGAFGSSIIAFVNGNKAIRAASQMNNKEEDLDGNNIKDTEENLVEVLKRYKKKYNIKDTTDYTKATYQDLLRELNHFKSLYRK